VRAGRKEGEEKRKEKGERSSGGWKGRCVGNGWGGGKGQVIS